MGSFTIENQSLQLCQERLASIVDENYIISAVLSDPASNAVASSGQQPSIAASDVARMSQLMMNIADDHRSARRNRIVCDLKGRPMVVMHADPLILTVIGKVDANMGMIVGIAEHSVEELRSIIRLEEAADIPQPSAAAQKSGSFSFDADGFTEKVLADLEKKRNLQGS